MVSGTHDLNNVIRFLKEWGKENKVNNDVHCRGPHVPKGRNVARIHGFSFCLGERGAPVLVNERVAPYLHSEEFAKVEMTVSGGTIRLVATPRYQGARSGTITLLSYTSRASDIDVMRRGVATKLGLKSRGLNSYVRAWLDCIPLSSQQFESLIQRLKRERGTGAVPKPHWEGRKDGYVDWPKLESRLRELGEIQLRYSGILRMSHAPEGQETENLDISEEFDPSYFDDFFTDDATADLGVMLDVLQVTTPVEEDGNVMEEDNMFWNVGDEEMEFGMDLIRQLEFQEAREEIRITHPYLKVAVEQIVGALGGTERAIRAIMTRSVPASVKDSVVDALVVIFNWWGQHVDRPLHSAGSDDEEEMGDDVDDL